MSNGGKRLKDLIKKRGYRLGAVAEAIGVAPHTMTRWTDNAPIGKLIRVSDFTGIPLIEVVESFRSQPESIDTDPTGIDRLGAIESKVDRMGGGEN
jgi:transcriptional regulator with XRE-family HTH domain